VVKKVPLSLSDIVIKGLVSTIIPAYNRPELLREAAQSVLDQAYRPIEIIIVDDGSTDDTAGVADKLLLDHHDEIRVIHQKNTGPGLAREAGRLIARGEYIQYLDSDDILLPEKFELQVAGIREHPECGVSYGKTRFYRKNETPTDVPWKRTGQRIETMFPSFLQSRWWGTSTPLYRRTLTDQAGPWTDLKNEEDWEYDCRIAGLGARLHYVAEFVSEERDHSGTRLSRDGTNEQTKLKYRALSHRLILSHAEHAGITEDFPEMQHYARELFLLSRQCGAAGLEDESRDLFDLARKASGAVLGNSWEFKAYKGLARLIGWKKLGKLSCHADRFRG
jgi:glycosyltransferase involved in cell wall biosynthesis